MKFYKIIFKDLIGGCLDCIILGYRVETVKRIILSVKRYFDEYYKWQSETDYTIEFNENEQVEVDDKELYENYEPCPGQIGAFRDKRF